MKLSDSCLKALSAEERKKLFSLLQEKRWREKYRKIDTYFPDTGELRRELYKKHMRFFNEGAKKSERLFMAGNRIGKTESAGGYETALHATGEYPDWWQGKRFDKPLKIMVAGDTGQTTKDILQDKLLGGLWDTQEWGTGLIPKDNLVRRPVGKSGITGAYAEVYVRHKSGGETVIKFRSYDQGRRIFQGQELDIFWADEEVPEPVYDEALLRTMTTNGIVYVTFTPLEGLTAFIKNYRRSCRNNESETRVIIQAGWDDVPHLSEEQKRKFAASVLPCYLEARRNGEPSLGAGAIYPIHADDIRVKPFLIPNHWDKAYALDVGWKRTAAIWGTWDRDEDVVYLYSEYYVGQEKPAVHADAIKSRGDWILGTIDPAARGRTQTDGKQVINLYQEKGLSLIPAKNSVEAGLSEVWSRLSTGRLKVFGSLANWFEEFGMYTRNEEGKIVKQDDHLMDATRYLIMMLVMIMTKQDNKKQESYVGTGDWRAI